MFNLFSAQIESLSLHRVGNKSKNEPMLLSSQPLDLNDELSGLLKEYFFKSFREKEENYFRFSHEADLEFNTVYESVKSIFEQPSQNHAASQKIAQVLHDLSNHPHIKNGEVYVAHFTEVLLDNEKMDAVGIFKSEIKQDFFQFKEQADRLELLVKQGININKLDKGCLIFNSEKKMGIRSYL